MTSGLVISPYGFSNIGLVAARLMLGVAIVGLFLMSGAVALPPEGQAQAGLDKIQQKLLRQYPDLAHFSAEILRDQMAAADGVDTLLFDVRKEKEYRVSHLKGAIRLDPALSGPAFWQQYGAMAAGKELVFYCSVGRRSSAMADRVMDSMPASGEAKIYNLEGGIFKWHNQQFPLFNEEGLTAFVHPYSWLWQRYLVHKELISYRPAHDMPPPMPPHDAALVQP